MYMQKAFTAKKPKLEFYGGKVDNVAASCPFDLIINLSGSGLFDTVTSTASLPKFTETLQAMVETPKLVIPWTDFGLPRLPKDAWYSLASDILALAKAKRGTQAFNVAVCCVGGTGRTGTCLAILKSLILNEQKDPVESIRKSYKFDAVETYSQIAYVEKVTGIKSRAKVLAKSTSYSYGSKTSATNPSKSAKDSALVFQKSTKDPECDSSGIECPASMKHTDACDKKYHLQKTGEPLPTSTADENSEKWDALTSPVVAPVCTGKGNKCYATIHTKECSDAFIAHHKQVINTHRNTDGCENSGQGCPGTNAHSKECSEKLSEQAKTSGLAAMKIHPSDCVCSDCLEFDAAIANKGGAV